jgi:hypothetical protein
MLNLTCINRYLWKPFYRNSTYQSLADKKWTICPTEKAFSPPAFYLDNQLENVISTEKNTNMETELKRLKGGETEHAQTIAFRLRNVDICKGYLYKRGYKLQLSTQKESIFISNRDRIEKYSEAALASTYFGYKYFGHWLTDDLPMILASQELSKPISISQELTPHQLEYSELLNIDTKHISHASFDKLIITDDFGQNSYKRKRYEYIRNKLASQIKINKNSSYDNYGVMFLRGSTGTKRQLLNELNIAEFLKQQGFIIIDPEKSSVSEIFHVTANAKIIVGVEGSQLAHGLFSIQENGALLILQPPYRFNNVFKDYADCLGLKYSFVVGKEVDNGFEIDLNELVKTLDLLNQ